MKARIPAMLVGAPGTGKTATIRMLAQRMGYELITVIGSQMEPTDVAGLPQGRHLGTTAEGEPIYGTVNLAPWWQVKIMMKKKIVLFMDEFSNTSGATRAALLTMFQSREFPNGDLMPPETIIVGAMNPVEQAADGYELDKPTTNRMLFIPWRTAHEAWYSGMEKAWGLKVSVLETAWRSKIVGFIKSSPGWLHKEPDEESVGDVFGINPNDYSEMAVYRYAWPSRRSWDNLARGLAAAVADPVVQDAVMQGLVGHAAAAAFRDWLLRNESFNLDEILADPDSINWKKLSVNDLNLILRGLMDSMEVDTYAAVGKVFMNLAAVSRESFAAPYVKSFLNFVAAHRGTPAEGELKRIGGEVLQRYRAISARAIPTS
jgi:hypothetical protein